MQSILRVIVLVYLSKVCSFAQRTSDIYAGFITPPLAAKPRALWTWVDGNFDKQSITFELEEAKKTGMGGFDIWDVNHVTDFNNLVPKGEPFMNAAYADAIVHAINEATRLDLELGLIVSSGWNAGGAWTKPEHATMGIFHTFTTLSGSGVKKISIPLPTLSDIQKNVDRRKPIMEIDSVTGLPKFFRRIATIAYPIASDSLITSSDQVIDLEPYLDAKGNLNWSVPDGKWFVHSMYCTNTGLPMFSSSPVSVGPMIDHFNPEATEVHIQYFIDKLLPKLGSFKGKALKYLYSDSYEVFGELWTPRMLKEFEKRKGYSMQPFLPTLKGFTVINKEATRRFLYDYRQVLSDLIIENHYLKAKEVCAKVGLGYVAEAAGPGQPLHNCPFESLKSSGVLTHPRGEFWHNHKDPINKGSKFDILQVIKGVASASHMYNQKIVDAEAFTSVWLWQESLNELKPTADNAFCEGLNRIVFHTFPHVPKSAGKPGWVYGFGTQVSVNQPWWPYAKPFMEYLGRCSYMLQQGDFFADILYYYGDNAPNFVPNKHYSEQRGYGYEYDVCNTDIILNKLAIDSGYYKLPHGPKYRLLVLPEIDEIPLSVLQKLDTLVRDGGILIGPKPQKSTGFNNYQIMDQKVRALADKMWGNLDGKMYKERVHGKGKIFWGISEKEVLSKLAIGPDLISEESPMADSIDFIHRKGRDFDLYFVRSKKVSPYTFTLRCRIANKKLQLWDPLTGNVYPAKYHTTTDGNTLVKLPLEAFGSMFLWFSNDTVERVSHNSTSFLNRVVSQTALKKDWKVTLQDSGKTKYSTQLPVLTDLSTHPDKKLKYFSGIITYENVFTLSGKAFESSGNVLLNLGNLGIVAEVIVNQKSAGIVWAAPYKLDITKYVKQGSNALQINVANRWVNKLIGDSKLPEKDRTTRTNITKLPNGWMYPMKDLPNAAYQMPPSGLLGPVSIIEIR